VKVIDQKQIKIYYIGSLPIKPEKNDLVVENDESYVDLCKKLSTASNQTFVIWVRKKNHFIWLKDYINQIDMDVCFKEQTPGLLLSEKWNVTIPDWLTDTKIIKENLLDFKIDFPKDNVSFETRILSYSIDPVFHNTVLNEKNLSELINIINEDQNVVNFNRSELLITCLERKCEDWIIKSHAPWVDELCERLIKNKSMLWHILSLRKSLNTYPKELLEYVLSPEQVYFVQKIPFAAITDINVEEKAKQQALQQIVLFFKSNLYKINNNNKLEKYINYCTGRFQEEYHSLIEILENKSFTVTTANIELIQDKFNSFPGITHAQLSSLIYYIKPGRPTLITEDDNLNAKGWIDWTINEYLPYRSWQIHNGYFDEELEKTVKIFSSWYIKEYIDVQNDSRYSQISNLSKIETEKNSLDIILLIDCLPLNFMQLIDPVLKQHGFFRNKLDYKFAALPSVTEYNKPELISGKWREGNLSYSAALEDHSKHYWNDKPSVYLSNLKEFSDLKTPQESTVLLLNFLGGDEILHSDVEAYNSTYEEELSVLYKRIVHVVSRHANEWMGDKEEFNIYIVTDHGACRILEEEKTSFDSKIVNNLFENDKYRYAAIDSDKENDIPPNLWTFGHKFKQPFYVKEDTFFMPEGHNTVKKTNRAKGYMHGGITPEEIIIPSAVYKMVKTVWEKLSYRFIDLSINKATGSPQFYIQRVIQIKIELQNPNNSSVNVSRVNIPSQNVDIKDYKYCSVEPGEKGMISMSCYFQKSILKEKRLNIELEYEIAGDQHTQSIELVCSFKSAISTSLNLRDL